MKKIIEINNASDMILLGTKIGKLMEENMVITLEGDLGAGKTTLTKGIAIGLDIKEIINSPTFTILKIHKGRLTLYHMDVYRINNDSGDEYLEEYFYSGGVTVIEWANNIDSFLPNDFLSINIEYLTPTSRRLTFEANSSKYIKIIESVTDNE